MRVVVFIKASEESEKDVLPSRETLEAMGKFNEELSDAGVIKGGEGLKPSMFGKRVVLDGPARIVTDGPFDDVRSLVAGFWLWDVKDMDEALAWAKRCPNPMSGKAELEIRPLVEAEDFGDALPAHVAEAEERIRSRLQGS